MVNLDIQDNHEEATLGAFLICEMCQAVSSETIYTSELFVISFCCLKKSHINIFEFVIKLIRVIKLFGNKLKNTEG